MDVKSDMVANVWRVLVSEGDTVEEGQELVILESMKMEIPVTAPAAGKVSRTVAEGIQVDEGDVLVAIDGE